MKKATEICFSESRGWTSRQSPESIGTLPSSPLSKTCLFFLLYSFFFLSVCVYIYLSCIILLGAAAATAELISIFILLLIQKDRAPPNWIWLTHHTMCDRVCVCSRLYFLLLWFLVVAINSLCANLVGSARPKNVVSSCPNPSRKIFRLRQLAQESSSVHIWHCDSSK